MTSVSRLLNFCFCKLIATELARRGGTLEMLPRFMVSTEICLPLNKSWTVRVRVYTNKQPVPRLSRRAYVKRIANSLHRCACKTTTTVYRTFRSAPSDRIVSIFLLFENSPGSAVPFDVWAPPQPPTSAILIRRVKNNIVYVLIPRR